jgi:hypothetical protein
MARRIQRVGITQETVRAFRYSRSDGDQLTLEDLAFDVFAQPIEPTTLLLPRVLLRE